MVTLFWTSIICILFAYAGYPLSMYLLKKYRGTHYGVDTHSTPMVSIIIAAADEENKIEDKLDNTAALEYPNYVTEIIVTLDGSTDQTYEIVHDWMDRHSDIDVILLDNKKGGKESAQKAAVDIATGEISVFTDVATRLEPNTIHYLVRHFGDKRIGAVDGMSRVEANGHSNEGAYLKYENKIREFESATTGLVTFGGCLFAARTWMLQGNVMVGHKKMLPGFRTDLQSDFRTALITRTYGYHSVIDTQAVATFGDGAESKEFGRKHRTIVRGINNLANHLYLLNPFKYGWFSYALFSHKLMKWFVPFFMIGALISNIVLAGGSVFWYFTLLIQIMFYIIAYGGMVTSNVKNPVFKIISFFVLTNAAILKAWYSYARGERFVSWTPTKR